MPAIKYAELTDQQTVWLESYLQCWNATQAAREAKYKNPSMSGWENLNNPAIRLVIQKRLHEYHMDTDEALKLMTDIARGDIGDYIEVDKDGKFSLNLTSAMKKKKTKLIKSIKQKTTKTSYGKNRDVETHTEQIELYPADVALERILRVHGELRDGGLSPASISGRKFSLPADMVAPAFLNAYRDIVNHHHTEYVFSGGRGSTKSSFISLVFIYLLINNPLIHGLATRQVGETLRGSVYARLVWAIGILGLSDQFKCITNPLQIEYLPTGQTIYFRGADDPGKIKSITPPFGYIGILWLEELDQFHGQEGVRNIEQSVIRGGDVAFIFKSFNPPKTKSNWANKYLLTPKENQYQHKSDYLTVPPEWLGKPWLDEAEHLKNTNPIAYENEYLGLSTDDGGMVFTNVQIRHITNEEIAQFDNVLNGQDWGFYPDPASYGKMHYYAARRTLYIFAEFRGWKLSNEELYKQLTEQATDEQHNTEYFLWNPNDPLIADSAEPKSIKDFKAYGGNCRGAEKGPESRRYSYKWLQGLNAIVIDDKRAPYHAEEFLNCEYERTKEGEIINEIPTKNDHAIDDTRYATNLIWRRKGE